MENLLKHRRASLLEEGVDNAVPEKLMRGTLQEKTLKELGETDSDLPRYHKSRAALT